MNKGVQIERNYEENYNFYLAFRLIVERAKAVPCRNGQVSTCYRLGH